LFVVYTDIIAEDLALCQVIGQLFNRTLLSHA